MLVLCDKCGAKYKITIKKKPGKSVTFKCGKCQTLIKIQPEQLAPADGERPSPGPAPPPRPEAKTACPQCGATFIKSDPDQPDLCKQCRIDSVVSQIKDRYGFAPPPAAEPPEAPEPSPESSRYTIRSADGLLLGPIKLRTVAVLAREKRIRGAEEVSKDDSEFQPLMNYPELAELFPELKEIMDTSGLEDKVEEAFMAAFGAEEEAPPATFAETTSPPPPAKEESTPPTPPPLEEARETTPEQTPEPPAPPTPEEEPLEDEQETSPPEATPKTTTPDTRETPPEQVSVEAPCEDEPESRPDQPLQAPTPSEASPPELAPEAEKPPPAEEPPSTAASEEKEPGPEQDGAEEAKPPPFETEVAFEDAGELEEPPAEAPTAPLPPSRPEAVADEPPGDDEDAIFSTDDLSGIGGAPLPAAEEEAAEAAEPQPSSPELETPRPPDEEPEIAPPPAAESPVGEEWDGEPEPDHEADLAPGGGDEDDEIIEDLEPLPEPSPDARYRIRYPDGLLLGPVKLAALKELLDTGNLTGSEEVQREDEDWVSFADLPELEELLSPAAAPEESEDEVIELTEVLEES